MFAADVNGRVIPASDLNGDICDLSQHSVMGSVNNGNVDGHYNINETFGEYSPQNSEFVHILTELGTPSRPNVNNDDFVDSQCIQGSQMSNFVPNQDFIAMLDNELADLPKDSYIPKLIELTNESDDTITWYRSILASRAKSIDGCPVGKLFTRKSTNKSSSIHISMHETATSSICSFVVIIQILMRCLERMILNL